MLRDRFVPCRKRIAQRDRSLVRRSIVADLNEVSIGIAEVHAHDRAGGASPLHGPILDRDATFGEVREHYVEGIDADQARVSAPR